MWQVSLLVVVGGGEVVVGAGGNVENLYWHHYWKTMSGLAEL